MRGEVVSVSAAAANSLVTLTLGTSATYGLVVFLDFAYSCRVEQFDIDGNVSFNGRSGDR